MCISNIPMHTGINSVVLAFYSKAPCFVNVCTRKALNCYFFYFLLRILWLQLNLTAHCRNQGRQNSSNYAETVLTLNFPYDAAAMSNTSQVQTKPKKWSNKFCTLIWKEDPRSMQQGPELQCKKKSIYQDIQEVEDQEVKYYCTFGNGSVCNDDANDSGGLRSFFPMLSTQIPLDTIYKCVLNCMIDINWQ